MDNKTKKILWGGGLIALGIIVYKLVFKKATSQVKGSGGGQTNGFPIYSNPLCNDGEAGGCEYDERVANVQAYLNTQGNSLVEDGLFGNDTAYALQNYLNMVSNGSSSNYSDWGYNYVETPNYITLAFYESIS